MKKKTVCKIVKIGHKETSHTNATNIARGDWLGNSISSFSLLVFSKAQDRTKLVIYCSMKPLQMCITRLVC